MTKTYAGDPKPTLERNAVRLRWWAKNGDVLKIGDKLWIRVDARTHDGNFWIRKYI